jgi:hypothetical protein
MPDDYHPPMPRRNPEDIDLGAIKADLEFLIERVAGLRKDQLYDGRECGDRLSGCFPMHRQGSTRWLYEQPQMISPTPFQKSYGKQSPARRAPPSSEACRAF